MTESVTVKKVISNLLVTELNAVQFYNEIVNSYQNRSDRPRLVRHRLIAFAVSDE